MNGIGGKGYGFPIGNYGTTGKKNPKNEELAKLMEREKRLKNGDYNGDGVVDSRDNAKQKAKLEEKIAKQESKESTYDINGDGKLDIEDFIASVKAAELLDKKGKVKKSELEKLSKEERQALDVNGDGTISASELKFLQGKQENIRTLLEKKGYKFNEDGSYAGESTKEDSTGITSSTPANNGSPTGTTGADKAGTVEGKAASGAKATGGVDGEPETKVKKIKDIAGNEVEVTTTITRDEQGRIIREESTIGEGDDKQTIEVKIYKYHEDGSKTVTLRQAVPDVDYDDEYGNGVVWYSKERFIERRIEYDTDGTRKKTDDYAVYVDEDGYVQDDRLHGKKLTYEEYKKIEPTLPAPKKPVYASRPGGGISVIDGDLIEPGESVARVSSGVLKAIKNSCGPNRRKGIKSSMSRIR